MYATDSNKAHLRRLMHQQRIDDLRTELQHGIESYIAEPSQEGRRVPNYGGWWLGRQGCMVTNCSDGPDGRSASGTAEGQAWPQPLNQEAQQLDDIRAPGFPDWGAPVDEDDDSGLPPHSCPPHASYINLPPWGNITVHTAGCIRSLYGELQDWPEFIGVQPALRQKRERLNCVAALDGGGTSGDQGGA